MNQEELKAAIKKRRSRPYAISIRIDQDTYDYINKLSIKTLTNSAEVVRNIIATYRKIREFEESKTNNFK